MRILIKGGGVAGLTAAYALTARGFDVEVAEISATIGLGASHFAGGMLAPWCEGESADIRVVEAGRLSIDWWDEALPGLVKRKGTLVVAPSRDTTELERFASRTTHFERVDEGEIAALEPALGGRFKRGLYFPDEAQIDPREALERLYRRLQAMGVRFHLAAAAMPANAYDHVIDCTGSAAIRSAPPLRGVRGEMLYLRTREISLSRPIRLLHPRIPLYIAPQSDGRFMAGATMIESDHAGPITARSLMELLNAAYALHPAFGEAEVIETGTGVRPAYEDNIPRISGTGHALSINGMYRHGFLMAPFLAEQLAGLISAQNLTREAS
jgi:glycine oxidase